MADLSTLARPYAKAAFDYAAESDVASDWEDFLFIASTIVNDSSFYSMLENPAISADEKAAALIDIYDKQVAVAGDTPFKALLKSSHASNASQNNYPKVSAQLRNFVNQLAQQERLSLIPEVYAHYRRHQALSQKQVDAYITSAYPLTDPQRALLQTRLAASLNAKVMLHEKVDSSLLAGATIKIGDKIVDDSVRGKLKQLKTQLTI